MAWENEASSTLILYELSTGRLRSPQVSKRFATPSSSEPRATARFLGRSHSVLVFTTGTSGAYDCRPEVIHLTPAEGLPGLFGAVRSETCRASFKGGALIAARLVSDSSRGCVAFPDTGGALCLWLPGHKVRRAALPQGLTVRALTWAPAGDMLLCQLEGRGSSVSAAFVDSAAAVLSVQLVVDSWPDKPAAFAPVWATHSLVLAHGAHCINAFAVLGDRPSLQLQHSIALPQTGRVHLHSESQLHVSPARSHFAVLASVRSRTGDAPSGLPTLQLVVLPLPPVQAADLPVQHISFPALPTAPLPGPVVSAELSWLKDGTSAQCWLRLPKPAGAPKSSFAPRVLKLVRFC